MLKHLQLPLRILDKAMHSHYRAIHLFFSADIAMAAALELESTLTDRYQTTVPDAVRRALKLGKRDKLKYAVQSNGSVLLTRAEKNESSDPVLGRFLEFLAQDIQDNPQRLRAVDTKWLKRMQSLVRNVKVDLDAPLPRDND